MSFSETCQTIKINTTAFLLNTSEEMSAYILAILTFALLIIINKTVAINVPSVLFLIPLFILLYGFSRFLIEKLHAFAETKIGKLVISTIFAIGAALSLGLANQAINTTLAVPSAPFAFTQSLVAILIAPLTISILLGFSCIFMLIASPFSFGRNTLPLIAKSLLTFWIKAKRTKMSNTQFFTQAARFIATFALMFACFTFIENNRWYTTSVGGFIKWFAFHFETELYSHCQLKKGSKIAYINKDDVIIATKVDGKYQFTMQTCRRVLLSKGTSSSDNN